MKRAGLYREVEASGASRNAIARPVIRTRAFWRGNPNPMVSLIERERWSSNTIIAGAIARGGFQKPHHPRKAITLQYVRI